MSDLAAVPRRPDSGRHRATRIRQQPTRVTERQAGQELGDRGDAQGQHQQVARIRVATGRAHAPHPAVAGGHPCDLGVLDDLDTCLGQRRRDAVAHVRVQAAHHLRPGQQGDGVPQAKSRLGHLDPEVAAARDHHPTRCLAGRTERPLEQGHPGRAVLEVLHRPHPAVRRTVRAECPVRDHRPGAGGDHELVESEGMRDVRLVDVRDRVRGQVDTGRGHAGPEVNSHVAVLLGTARDQIVGLANVAGEPVGDAARRVRRVLRPFERHRPRWLGRRPSRSAGPDVPRSSPRRPRR